MATTSPDADTPVALRIRDPQAGADPLPSRREAVDDSNRRAERLRTRTANICTVRLLERIAAQFNKAGIPLMALKGAALNLTVYDRADQRPMSDLDFLVKHEHVNEAFALLEAAGCLRGEPLVREDFFPRYHYETEFTAGRAFHMRIDLHVRPFRPLRWAGLVPPHALWERAESVPAGSARVLIPSAEDMLIHLAAHSSIHGNQRRMWLEDIRRWADANRDVMDWERLLSTVQRWGLTLPVREAITRADDEFGGVCPTSIRRRLARLPVGWRDRLALWQAPRDAEHPVSHVAVNLLCTPGWRFTLGYLWAVLFPDRQHMADWTCRRHRGWLACAHVLRLASPVTRHLPRLLACFSKFEIRRGGSRGIGVFATRDLRPGEIIARLRAMPDQGKNAIVSRHKNPAGAIRRDNVTGKLRYLKHCCRPSAALSGLDLRAVRPIQAGKEITIDDGEDACDCRQRSREMMQQLLSA